jgi:hypothetical protein
MIDEVDAIPWFGCRDSECGVFQGLKAPAAV